jgi:hypothetical protein
MVEKGEVQEFKKPRESFKHPLAPPCNPGAPLPPAIHRTIHKQSFVFCNLPLPGRGESKLRNAPRLQGGHIYLEAIERGLAGCKKG